MKGMYRQAEPDKVSEPKEFIHPQEARKQPLTWLHTRKEDHENDFHKLQTRFEVPQGPSHTPKIMKREPPPNGKGKGKALEPKMIENEHHPLHERWCIEYADIMGGTKDELPPWHKVNHKINLIDDNKCYHYYLLHCPHSLREEFHEKINQYMDAG